jgi:hypothetical protein
MLVSVISEPFLGNSSVNIFPWQWLCMLWGKLSVVYTVHTEEVIKKTTGATE